MGFYNKLKKILDDEKPKLITKICTNFWCKARYEVLESDLEDYPEYYNVCPKCRSFDNELSGGVVNNGQREYEGDRFDGELHEINIKSIKGNGF